MSTGSSRQDLTVPLKQEDIKQTLAYLRRHPQQIPDKLSRALHDCSTAFQDALTTHLKKATLETGSTPAEWFVLACLNANNGHDQDALVQLRKVLQTDINHLPAIRLAIHIYQRLSQPDNADNLVRHAVSVLQTKARAAEQQGQPELALASHRECAELAPHDPVHSYNCGVLLQATGQYKLAEDAFSRSLAVSPDSYPALINRALSRKALQNQDGAEQDLSRAIQLQPDNYKGYHHLGILRREQGVLHEAVELFGKVLELEPEHPNANYDLGKTHLLLDQRDHAKDCFQKAIEQDKDHAQSHFELAMLALSQAEWERGWRGFEWRIAANTNRRHSYLTDPRDSFRVLPRPSAFMTPGQFDADTTACIQSEGLGDELFYLRYMATIENGIYCTNTKILPLLQRHAFPFRITPDAPKHITRLIGLHELPLYCADCTPKQSLQLQPLQQKLELFSEKLHACGPPPYIGLTWRAGRQGLEGALSKEFPLSELASLMSSLQGTLISLQRNPAEGEILELQQLSGRTVHDFSSDCEDLEDALALMDLLDDYIGVSNTNMHLRASLSKTAHVLVCHPPDWRYSDLEPNPWFPQFHVHRETAQGWCDAVSSLKDFFPSD